MEYKEFLNYVKEHTKHLAGDDGKASINHVIKNNGTELDGLVIMPKGMNISPTIYLNSFYEEYMGGEPIDKILETIETIYKEHKSNIKIDPTILERFDNVKDRILYKVINYDSNEKLLSMVPHKRILDLAIVFYIMIDCNSESSTTALIYENTMKNWKVTIDDIYEVALKNTPNILKCKVSSMGDMLKEFYDKEDTPDFTLKDMYVLTNESKINGASCMLYENVLYELSKKLKSDLYILPSSIHEVIILPKREEYNREFLENMVREVNTDGVKREEVLSDNVYEYNRKDRLISM